MLQPRVWIKNEKYLDDVEELDFGCGFISTETDKYHYHNFDDVVFMQNTTMKDVNDKYIYEGDIVRDINTGELFVIRYDLNKGWRLDNSRCGLRSYNYKDNLAVVGNVFENEELFDEYGFFEGVRKDLERILENE